MIELKIQASSPDMLRDTILAFGNVMQSGLLSPGDQVTMTATDTTAPGGTTEIEACIDLTEAALAEVIEEVHAAVTEPIGNDSPDRRHTLPVAPEPKKRGRKPKLVTSEPVPDVEPPPEVVTEEDEQEALGADEPPAPPPPAPKLKAVRPAEPIEYTRDDLRAAVKKVMDEHGVPETLVRLGTVGYKRASEVPDNDFERAINALLGA